MDNEHPIDVDANEVLDLITDSEEDEQQEPPPPFYYRTFLEGPPQAMPRPAFMSWVRNGLLVRRVVNKAKMKVEQTRQQMKAALKERYQLTDDNFPIYPTCGVRLSVLFYRRIPTSWFPNNNRNNQITGRNLNGWDPDLQTPDADNLLKFIMDALEGVAYTNDSQVVLIFARKFLDDEHPHNGRTSVNFRHF